MLKKNMGPMCPSGLGPWAPRDLGPNLLEFCEFPKFDKSCSKGPILNPQIGSR